MKRIINTTLISKIAGIILLIIAGFILLCSIVALIYHEPVMPFIYATITTFIPGILLFTFSKPDTDYSKLTRKDAYFMVTVSWLILGISSALPYIYSNSMPSIIDAIFESISGISTTGASILTDIEALPKSILFWRSMTHWIGGIGIIMIVIVVMPSFKIGGYHLFSMESSLQEKIKPRTYSIGIRLLLIYIILTLLEVLCLLAGGMNLFESLCHSFGTVATGGFSPKNDSIAGYSPYIQYIITIFMFLAGVNFSLYYYLVRREFKKIRYNSEFWFYLGVVAIIGFGLTLMLHFTMNMTPEKAFRDAFFNIVSIITCTGFANSDYLLWPVYGWFILFLAMFLGASTGSTTGSIKMARHLILLKNMKRIIVIMIHPTAVVKVWFNHKPVPEETNNQTLAFIMTYMVFFTIATALMTFLGSDFITSAGSVATCMAGIGPGLGSTGPVANFGHLSDAIKILLSIMMLLGRLEIYTVIVLFSRSFWKV